MKTAGVAVVGGGVIGASVAYHLAASGVRDVVILDRGHANGASASTTKATGGFRAQFSTAVNIQLSLLSRDKLRRFGEEIGADPGFEAAGYLWLADTDDELAGLRAALAVQHREGLTEAVEVDRAAVAEINPAVASERVIGGTFCPTDGFIRPRAIREGYLAAAQRLGVKCMWDTNVIGATLDANDTITSLHTTAGMLSVERVVNAAGPWAAELGMVAEAEVCVAPLRRQVAVSKATNLLPASMPMTIFVTDGFHARARDGRVLLLKPSPGADDNPFDTSLDDGWLEEVVAAARERFPGLATLSLDRASCFAGLYEMSPDGNAILGASTECANLYLANGSSGHGVMHAPALGGLLADVICGKIPTIDISPLRPSRFDDGSPPSEKELL